MDSMERTLAEINSGGETRYGAFLFDLDGTVADSMPIHLVSWQQAVGEHGGTFPEELFWAWGGVPLRRAVQMLNERFGLNMDVEAVVRRKEDLYLSRLAEVKAVPAMVMLIDEHAGRMPMAIVSGSPRETIERTLDALQLRDRFRAIVGSEDYLRGKPDPEPFLTAAKLLNVPAALCLVFEDAPAGFQSAQAAGMDWVRVVA